VRERVPLAFERLNTGAVNGRYLQPECVQEITSITPMVCNRVLRHLRIPRHFESLVISTLWAHPTHPSRVICTLVAF